MRALVQRVKNASVSAGGTVSGEIQGGMLILLGVTHTDTSADAAYLAGRCSTLRIFEDPQQKMNLALQETGGSALVVSQFTLYADTRKGHRPSFVDAARPEVAETLYNEFVSALRAELGAEHVKTGVFKAMMEIRLVNDGPVTIMLESKNHTS